MNRLFYAPLNLYLVDDIPQGILMNTFIHLPLFLNPFHHLIRYHYFDLIEALILFFFSNPNLHKKCSVDS